MRKNPVDDLKDRLRAGLIPVEMIKLASSLGHEDARALFPREDPIDWSSRAQKIAVMSRLSKNAQVLLVTVIAERASRIYKNAPQCVIKAIDRSRSWCMSRTPENRAACSTVASDCSDAARRRWLWERDPWGNNILVLCEVAASVAWAIRQDGPKEKGLIDDLERLSPICFDANPIKRQTGALAKIVIELGNLACKSADALALDCSAKTKELVKKARIERALEKRRQEKEKRAKEQKEYIAFVAKEYGSVKHRQDGYSQLECFAHRANGANKKCICCLIPKAIEIGQRLNAAKLFLPVKNKPPTKYSNEPSWFVLSEKKAAILDAARVETKEADEAKKKAEQEEALRDHEEYWSKPENAQRWRIPKPFKASRPLGPVQRQYLLFLQRDNDEATCTQIAKFLHVELGYHHRWSWEKTKAIGMSLWRRGLIEPTGLDDGFPYPHGFRLTEAGSNFCGEASEPADE